jgi:hypothetical protein
MQFIPYRILRNEPSALRQKLADEGELIITVDGKPFAVMIDLSDAESLDDIMLLVSRLRAQMAVRVMRSKAKREGLDKLGEEEIDEIIRKTREERNQ